MAGKQGPPAPIDNPLGSSYLRGFDGWSTAYPPELSSPTSVRQMRNLLVTDAGGLRIRPGLRFINKPLNFTGDVSSFVGDFETFPISNTTRGMITAVRVPAGVRFVYFEEQPDGFFEEKIPALDPNQPSVMYHWTNPLPSSVTYIRYLSIDNKVIALPDHPAVGAVVFHVGNPSKINITRLGTGGMNLDFWGNPPEVVHPNANWIRGYDYAGNSGQPQTYAIDPQVPRAADDGTLINSDEDKNIYTFGYFYTFETLWGETKPSGITEVQTQRPWSQWRMVRPKLPSGSIPDTTSGLPTKSQTAAPYRAMDQLVVKIPPAVWNGAIDAGAIRLNVYMITWSENTVKPAIATLVGRRNLPPVAGMENYAWIAHTPAAYANGHTFPLPSSTNRVDYSGAPTATQGIVAGDRLILVNDRSGRILWSGNSPNEYLNFTPNRGGGQKTLSAGNLSIPTDIQLWQNPQSVDTLTILCTGIDGNHRSYYMAPAEVQGGSDNTIIMGFEETTAAPGSIAPYGCEVLNSALYRPTEMELVKSTASNYVITHTGQTDDISNNWKRLVNKTRIGSESFDGCLYYLVHNPATAAPRAGNRGNEIWVLRPSKEGSSWSRWIVQGISLRKVEFKDQLYLGLLTDRGLMIADPASFVDDDRPINGVLTTQPISWSFETNLLGANSRRDAAVDLRKATLHLGDWFGSMEWGIRGMDLYGRVLDRKKVYHAIQSTPSTADGRVNPGQDLGDTKDDLQAEGSFIEWTLYANSIAGVNSYGQIDMARFMFSQLTTNFGYNLGALDTFEYQRNAASGNNGYTQNGIPLPRQDVRRP